MRARDGLDGSGTVEVLRHTRQRVHQMSWTKSVQEDAAQTSSGDLQIEASTEPFSSERFSSFGELFTHQPQQGQQSKVDADAVGQVAGGETARQQEVPVGRKVVEKRKQSTVTALKIGAAKDRLRTTSSIGGVEQEASAPGKRLAIFWVGERRWFAGVIKGFDETKEQHIVHYDDGDVRLENVKVLEDSSFVEWLQNDDYNCGGDCEASCHALKTRSPHLQTRSPHLQTPAFKSASTSSIAQR